MAVRAVNIAPTLDYVVQASATVTNSPATITLSWPADSRSTSYKIARRVLGSTTWGTDVTVPGTAATLKSWTDTSVTAGVSYEYRIARATSIASGVVPPYNGTFPTLITAYGYLSAGINVPAPDQRGKIILLVDQTMATPLAREIRRLTEDLVGDGWTVLRHDVSRTDTVPNVKALIKTDYLSDPAKVKTVFILGHIPVPYSGYAAFDGHDNHEGAWATDTFYADMDGNWTDTTVDTRNNPTQPAYPENVNIPGDGKYDQSGLLGPLELAIGRVDLSNMPTSVTRYGLNETELLRQYLNKDHNHRIGLVRLPRRGFVDDTSFGASDGQAFAQTGWRVSSSLFGAGATTPGTMRDLVSNGGAMFYYLDGPGSVAGCGNYSSSNFTANPQFAFMINFGSYFGDFDKANNFERAALCTSTGLTNSWGVANTFLHAMAVGGTIGEANFMSQNNDGVNYALTYRDFYCGAISSSLMGDPTLRLLSVTPPGSLSITVSGGHPALAWTASPEATLGYSIYRSTVAAGPFVKVASGITATTWLDASVQNTGTYVYQVKASKLETTGGGTYINLSLPATSQVALGTPLAPVPTAVAPLTGTILGGTTLTITGTRLTSASSVNIGGVAVTPTAVNDTEITVLAPAHAAGPVAVTVTTPGGTASVSSGYTYAAAVPTVTTISPNASAWNGRPITLTGTNLTNTSSVTFGGVAAVLQSVSDTQVICALPAHATGLVNVVVTAPGGSVTKTNAFNYQAPDPGGFLILPKNGIPTGGTPVTITAFNFSAAPTVTFAGVSATSINVVSLTELTCVTPAGTAGNAQVVITAAGGATRTATAFSYVTNLPVVTSIVAATGPSSGGTLVTINGTNLIIHGLHGVTFGGIEATELVQVSSTKMTCVTPAHAAGLVDVVYTNLDGSTVVPGAFTYTAPVDAVAPVLSAISAGTPSQNSATITWTTNENADAQVQYGTTTSYGYSTTINPALITAHSLAVTGLTPGTLYHYRVLSRDASGNLATSADKTFTTTGTPFAAWKETFFSPEDSEDPLISGPLADPDGDGLCNIVEYYLDSSPLAAGNVVLPGAVLSGGTLQLVYQVDQAKTDLTVVPEYSTDLVVWGSVGVTDTIIATSGTVDTHQATVSTGNNKGFLRLRQTME